MRTAFTLSEVLVTLTILGIVASITIPNLMQQYKKAQTISRLKMAYSIIEKVHHMSYIEHGYSFWSKEEINPDLFQEYYGKYLSIAKECGLQREVKFWKNSGCFKSGSYMKYGESEWAQDKDGKDLKDENFYNLDGKCVQQGGYDYRWHYMVLLKNGMSFAVIWPGHYVIDIDGPNKGESKIGQDVFVFNYEKCLDKGGLSYPGKCDLTRAELIQRCKPNGTDQAWAPNGSGCAGLIIKDGWKISKDYPWDYAQKKIK